MKKYLLSIYSLVMLLGVISTANIAQGQVRPYRVTDRQVLTTLTRIETNTDIYKQQVNNALRRGVLSSGDSETTFNDYITEFETATSNLSQDFEARRSTSADVEEVLNRANDINQFMQRNRLNAAVQRSWTTIRNDLSTLATYYNVRWNWNNSNQNTGTFPGSTGGTTRPYRVSDNNVQTLLARIETRTDAYRREVNSALDRSVLNNTRSEDSIVAYINEFETATDKLRGNFISRRSASADVEEVLNRAYYIDGFMRDYRLTTAAESQWRLIRGDLDTLSTYYNVSWNWNRQYSPAGSFDTRLTGTYRLNTSQSDSVADIVNRSTVNSAAAIRDRQRTNLERRLSSPDTLAIEKRGNQVTIASSNSPQVSFNADGVARTETTGNGRSIRVTATTNYDGIALSYEGDRANDFYVNFNQISNDQLRVVRRVYLENRNETITVASVYDKISQTADLSISGNQNTGGNGSLNDFVIADNTRVTAILRTPVSTKVSQNGDRFQMEVTSPSQYSGAIIEGRVAKTERSGRVSGRANMSLEFDTIRLRNGQTYRFAGIVDDVTTASGEKVTVNNEGTVRDNNQTTKTVTRAGIGAAIGAIIGAIAGGGSGAAIGAGVGAGAGAGSVILQGRDDVELGEGTTFSITATAPNGVNR
jgi:hypothetical protein